MTTTETTQTTTTKVTSDVASAAKAIRAHADKAKIAMSHGQCLGMADAMLSAIEVMDGDAPALAAEAALGYATREGIRLSPSAAKEIAAAATAKPEAQKAKAVEATK